MSFLGTGFAGARASYSITNSIRLNGTSDYLSKTLTTSATTSGSIWVKRSKLGATSPIFDNKVYFTSGDALYAFGLTSTALYRDPSAWMHIFWNSTGVYVNGALITGSGSYTASFVTNPRLGYDGTNFFSGYLSDFAFWNGTSASLQGGATDANGVWAPKRPSAGYSFLAFGSSGALGTDTSGNGNNWTVNGSPVQTTDTPTNNYSMLNSIDYYDSSPSTSLSVGNTVISKSTSSGSLNIRSTMSMTVETYWEITVSVISNSPYPYLGISPSSANINISGDFVCNTNANSIGIRADGYTAKGGVSQGTFTGFSAGQTLGFHFVPATGALYVRNSGGWFNSGNPIATVAAGTDYMPWIGGNAFTAVVNSGATAFAYTPPAGAKTLCTANMVSAAGTTSGTFEGNASADGPFIWANGNPATLTINGNAVTFGTHADKTAGGFKLRTSSASYNTSGSNTWTATAGKRFVYSATSINTAQGNP